MPGCRHPTQGPRGAVLAPERERTAPAPGRGAAAPGFLLLRFCSSTSPQESWLQTMQMYPLGVHGSPDENQGVCRLRSSPEFLVGNPSLALWDSWQNSIPCGCRRPPPLFLPGRKPRAEAAAFLGSRPPSSISRAGRGESSSSMLLLFAPSSVIAPVSLTESGKGLCFKDSRD